MTTAGGESDLGAIPPTPSAILSLIANAFGTEERATTTGGGG